MKSSILSFYDKFRQITLLKFLLVGGLGALIELGIFVLMRDQKFTIVASNVIAFHVAFVFCFICHRLFTYQTRHQSIAINSALRQFLLYTGLMYFQFVVGTALLYLLMDIFLILAAPSKFIQIAIVTPTSYLIQKKIIFKAAR